MLLRDNPPAAVALSELSLARDVIVATLKALEKVTPIQFNDLQYKEAMNKVSSLILVLLSSSLTGRSERWATKTLQSCRLHSLADFAVL